MMLAQAQRYRPWVYSVLLHCALVLFLVLSFHWSSSMIPSLGGHNPEAEPVKATVVDQGLIDQQLAMLKAQQQKKQEEKQQLEQNISELKKQQQTTQAQMNQQLADMQKQAQDEQDRVAKLKAEDEALSQKKKTADTAARRKQLQDEIASEERSQDARLASMLQKWVALIQLKITNSWVKPPSAPDGLHCLVRVTQVPGGTVTNAQVTACNGDDAVVQSIITAAYKASPLPPPPDPSLFDQGRTLNLHFDPKGP
jgi:colicin import membrane protein